MKDAVVIIICVLTMPFYFLGRRAYWELKRRIGRV